MNPGCFGIQKTSMALAAAGVLSVTIPVPGDADYAIGFLTGKAEDSSKAALRVAVTIQDQGNSYFYVPTYQSLDLLVGNGQNPMPIVNGPWFFKRATNVVVSIQNQEAATALDFFEMVFIGERRP